MRREKGASLQWEEDIPPGNCRSSRKQPERSQWATTAGEAFGAIGLGSRQLLSVEELLPLAFASRYQSLRGGDRNSPTLSFREGNFFMADRDVNWRVQTRRLLGLIALLAREFAPIDCLPPRHRAL